MHSLSSEIMSSLSKLTNLRNFVTTLLKAYSQAYILITLIPTMISFMMRIRLSVIFADLNLRNQENHTFNHQVLINTIAANFHLVGDELIVED